ncbi:MAG: hypothetical protein BM557_11465 [Flavobacterium sp. MedPE-SWcel]|uniref:DUF6452 family protein n=1 Tax=uncultured Flavobacterium sp. TaxID=165435 RepID=UPI000915497E|nr:DUF6452 family protein [uncultured Flavobacterium sp.]OIQ15379.1 MAG: hypothetical protein BM557_11465 [Flavobacterium sp. MedPE-SWcel]
MRRIIVSVVFAIIASCYLWSCEKDDICADGTPVTPSLIISMYNKDNQTEKKQGNIQYYMDVDGVVNEIGPTVTDSLVVPLRTDAEVVKWGFTLITSAAGGGTNENTDFLEFKYTHDEIYVSRACGYKSLFYLNEDTTGGLNPELTDNDPADNLWIEDVVVIRSNIEDENSAHVKIYF